MTYPKYCTSSNGSHCVFSEVGRPRNLTANRKSSAYCMDGKFKVLLLCLKAEYAQLLERYGRRLGFKVFGWKSWVWKIFKLTTREVAASGEASLFEPVNFRYKPVMNLLLAFISLAYFTAALSPAQRQQIPTQLSKSNKRIDANSNDLDDTKKMVAQITERAKSPEAVKGVQYYSFANGNEGDLTQISGGCIDGTYVFGTRVVTQLYYVTIAMRASGKTCLIGDITLTGEQIEKSTTLMYLVGTLQISCQSCVSGIPFPNLAAIATVTDASTPTSVIPGNWPQVPNRAYESVYASLIISDLQNTALSFPKLEELFLDSPERADKIIYFATMFIINVTNTSINFPSLLDVVGFVNATHYDDYPRGIAFRYLTNSPIAMPLLKLISLGDYQVLNDSYIPQANSLFGFYMSNNVQSEEVSYPKLDQIEIFGANNEKDSTSAVYLQLLNGHASIHFDGLKNLLLETGTAFQFELTTGLSVSADGLQSFRISNTQYVGSINGLVTGGSNSALDISFASLVEAQIEADLKLETCLAFTIWLQYGSNVHAVSCPSLRAIKATASAGAIGIEMLADNVEMDLRSLEAVNLEVPAGQFTRSVYGGPENPQNLPSGHVTSRYAKFPDAAVP
eukprot:g67530.t1